MAKTKIAILGGGPAGLAAAWELTRRPGWQEETEVTVYQMGWRLGGKCATGRGGSENRIEEHGIHVLMGSYNAAFTIIRDCYGAREELGVAKQSPFATWEDAFIRLDDTIMSNSTDPTLIRWQPWTFIFKQNDTLPGAGPPPPIWDVLVDALAVGLEALLGSPYATSTGPLRRWILSWFYPDTPTLCSRLTHKVADALPHGSRRRTAAEGWAEQSLPLGHREAHDHLQGLVSQLRRAPDPTRAQPLVEILDFFEHLVNGAMKLESILLDIVKRDLALIEFALVVLRGLLADVWNGQLGGWDFSGIDDVDFRAWLAANGASDNCLYSAPVRFLYAGTFSNTCDSDGNGGQFAAGVALRSCIKMLAYHGSLVWQMRAGTGDTIIAPLFQVLQARGVKFEFFHRVTKVHDSGDDEIQQIDLVRQARLKKAPYRPLKPVKVANGVVDAWPDRPRFDQLHPDDAAEIKKVGWNNECARVKGRKRTLKLGRDFDQVVLATPVATLPFIAPEIVARLDVWKRTVDKVKTTSTQNFQIWLTKSNQALGVPLDQWGVNTDHTAPNNETYANGFTAWADASVTIPYETWPEGAVGAVAYICGAYNDTGPIDPADVLADAIEEAVVRGRAQQWCTDNAGWMYRGATTREQPFGLDYNELAVSPDVDATEPIERWEAQYFRANRTPAERYTLSVPGSVYGVRMWYDETGFSNLFCAGDWVCHEGLNAGFVDGAMLCGIEAGRALRKRLGLVVGEPFDFLPPDLIPNRRGEG